jgi:hypothetical protein
MDKARRDEIRKRCEAAPHWRPESLMGMPCKNYRGEEWLSNAEIPRAFSVDQNGCVNGPAPSFMFIAHSRTDLPDALDALDAAERRIAELEAEVARLREGEECHVARPGEGTYECNVDSPCPACRLREAVQRIAELEEAVKVRDDAAQPGDDGYRCGYDCGGQWVRTGQADDADIEFWHSDDCPKVTHPAKVKP